jgi:hypothetical protein
MARLAATDFGADWIIHADADEFFLWRDGTLKDALARVPPEVTRLRARRHDFVPFDRPRAAPPPLEMIHRKAVSLNQASKPLPPKIIHRADPEVVVVQGNHSAKGPRLTGPAADGDIEVFHYPIRSYAQFERRVRCGGEALDRNAKLDPGHGFHKRRWLQMLRSGDLEREYQERQYYNQDRLARALAEGELIEDRTLAERLSPIDGNRSTETKAKASN